MGGGDGGGIWGMDEVLVGGIGVGGGRWLAVDGRWAMGDACG